MSNWSYRQHTQKSDGRKIWYVRSRQLVRGEDGVVRRKQVEHSTGTVSKHEARERARELSEAYVEAKNRPVPEAKKPARTLTFADAVSQYIGSNRSERYLEAIVKLIGLKPAAAVDQETILDVCARLYPNAKASTKNRQVYTPVLAALKIVGIRPNVTRPHGHDKLPVVDRSTLPPDGWHAAVMEHLSPSKRACMLLINLHGLRISEAAQRRPADVDPKRWTLTLPNSKDGNPYVIRLSEPVIEAIKAIPDWRKQKWLFGTGERGNIGRAFRNACEKAGVKTYGTHRIGRHSFAAQILEEGKSLPFLKSAGRWASLKAVERYAHLAENEVADEVRELGKKWHGTRKAGEIVKISEKRKTG